MAVLQQIVVRFFLGVWTDARLLRISENLHRPRRIVKATQNSTMTTQSAAAAQEGSQFKIFTAPGVGGTNLAERPRRVPWGPG